MLWATMAFDDEVSDERLIASFVGAFGLQPDEVAVANSSKSEISGGPADGGPTPLFLLTKLDEQLTFPYTVDVLASGETPPLNESVPVLEAIVDAVGVRAIALLEWEPEYHLLRPGKPALLVELDEDALERREWVMTPESLAKAEAT